ncbi:flagellar biosynthesis protein FlgA [Herbidospora sp. NEAU-GS84]|uniref:Flagellar biosynthesis protein FlgA n=1 Tax=Herbidospora solisilvae TaxID=2696284 RepID=A0A7C9NBG6_9ACTN|nr:SAF domain-containing protein [Herbidospora solisilvae]NAS26593.1 flagellar biosynthesis protein FlgA [Herbidospora solisilvae]
MRVAVPARWARVLARRRRLISAVLLGLAVAGVLVSVRAPSGVAVLVAARDLSGGRLAAGDLSTVRVPSSVLPDGYLAAGSPVVGRVLTAPARRGEVLTDARLLGSGLLASNARGVVATPVRVEDADAAELVTAGDVIDVLAAYETHAETAAERVTVLTKAQSEEGGLLVLATTTGQAASLARAQAGARLSIAIHPR